MKRVYVLATLVCLQLSCTTVMWEPGAEPLSQTSPPQEESFSFAEMTKRISERNRQGLLEDRRQLERKLAANPAAWEDQLQLALVMMSVEEQGKDFERIQELLLAVARNEAAHSDARINARWLQSINQQTRIATVQWRAEIEKNADLQQKLHALSTIEKKLDKRSRQEMR